MRHHKSQNLTSVLKYSRHIFPTPAQTPYEHNLQHKYPGDTSPWYGHKGMKQNRCYTVQKCTAQSSWDKIPQYNYRALIPCSCTAITAWLTPGCRRHRVGVHRGYRHLRVQLLVKEITGMSTEVSQTWGGGCRYKLLKGNKTPLSKATMVSHSQNREVKNLATSAI